MGRKRGIVLIIFVFLIILSNLNYVSAIGISGIRLVENLDFEPYLERTFYYRVGTNADHAMNYSIHVKDIQGDIARYIIPSVSTVYLEAIAGFDFSAYMLLPESLDPGLHVAHICALETEARGGGNIGVRTEVCAVINVKVLYPGKYIVIKSLDITVANKQVTFDIEVENWGTQLIDLVKGTIEVYEVNRTTLLTSVNTNQQSLDSNAAATLTASLNAEGFNVGDYLAKATVFYDAYEEKIEKQFKIGELELRVINYTKEFEVGKISPMEVEVESIWNQEIKDVHAEINVTKDGQGIQTVRTPPINIRPWGKTILVGYLDTNDMEAGNYTAYFTILYAGKSTVDSGMITVKETRIELPKLSVNTLLLMAVLILLVLLIILVLRKKSRQQSG